MEGGAGIYISELARAFPRDSELHVVTSGMTRGNVGDTEGILEDSVFVHRLKGSTGSLIDDFTFKMNVVSNLRQLIADSQADVIHTSSRMPDILCSPNRMSVPIVTTVHSTIGSHVKALTSPRQFRSAFSKREQLLLAFGRFMVLAENRYYKSDRHFICVSSWGKRDLQESKGVDRSRISVIPNGVDVDRFSPSLKNAPNDKFPEIAERSAMKILYVGRFTFAKGFPNLLRTIDMAIDDPRLHFVIAGSGPHAIPKAILDKCTVVGQVPHGDMPHLYAACDALIVPSLYENMPFTILEAMASGCVPIASDVGGIGEVVHHGKNGILVPPGHSEAMLSAIWMLSQDQGKMKDMANAARNSITAGFGMDRTIKETVNLLARVCSEGTRLHEEQASESGS